MKTRKPDAHRRVLQRSFHPEPSAPRERQSWPVHSAGVDWLFDRHRLLILKRYLTVHALRTYWNVYYTQKEA